MASFQFSRSVPS
jgi:hypothetical protein